MQRLCANMSKGPLLFVPADVRMQPVDSDDFASWLVDCATGAPRGRHDDFAGPEVLTVRKLMEQYLDACGTPRKIRNLPLPSAARAALERGQTAPAARRGTTTWKEWLAAHAPLAQNAARCVGSG
jgi:uncharacterized protein YbjT (DUF2867 family)